MRLNRLNVFLIPMCLMILAANSAPAAMAKDYWQPVDGERIAFEILRNGKRVGDHVVTFERKDEYLTVSSDIQIKVKIGPITVYRYGHNSQETWKDGRVVEFEGATKKRGDRLEGDFPEGLDSNTIPLTHWNLPAILEAQFVVNDSFFIEPLQLQDLGVQAYDSTVDGDQARRLRIEGQFTVDLWYDNEGRWIGCAFVARGDDIVYRLKES